ncbi:hypothetical protein D1007_52453 [Hordeum vulgare]|nr:hypothetical protein D1007_52453 [Hordeum vulgare]
MQSGGMDRVVPQDEIMEDIEGGTYIPFAVDATTTRPDVPYVGLVFDTIEEAQKVYNSYAKKLGFGTRICYTKRTRKKGCNHIIRREFECVHAGGEKPKMEENKLCVILSGMKQ